MWLGITLDTALRDSFPEEVTSQLRWPEGGSHTQVQVPVCQAEGLADAKAREEGAVGSR